MKIHRIRKWSNLLKFQYFETTNINNIEDNWDNGDDGDNGDNGDIENNGDNILFLNL